MTFEEELQESISDTLEKYGNDISYAKVINAITDVTDKWCFRKPLTKDGEIIKRKGKYYGEDGKAWQVTELVNSGANGSHCIRAKCGGVVKELKPEWLSSKPPVLAADGLPLEVGQTVYMVEDSDFAIAGSEAVVQGFEDVYVIIWDGEVVKPEWLTHTRPDSLERIREDANKTIYSYWGCGKTEYYDCDPNCEHSGHCTQDVKLDLIDRTVKMMERGR